MRVGWGGERTKQESKKKSPGLNPHTWQQSAYVSGWATSKEGEMKKQEKNKNCEKFVIEFMRVSGN